MREVARAACAGGLGATAHELLPKFESALLRETTGSVRSALEKNAISKAPEDLISRRLGATTVVNGAHPVLIALDTVQKKNGVVRTLLLNLLRIDDELKVFRQK